MADEQDQAQAQGPPAKSGSTKRDWIIRGVVFGTLAILLVLALLDFRAKKNAENTYDTWQATMQANDKALKETFPKDLEAIASGSFVMIEDHLGGVTRRKYIWNGVFRSYPILMYLIPGENPMVSELTPPSEAAEELAAMDTLPQVASPTSDSAHGGPEMEAAPPEVTGESK